MSEEPKEEGRTSRNSGRKEIEVRKRKDGKRKRKVE